jgi:serine/threonine protein kinase
VSDLIGQIIGNYRIEAAIGRGGMGQVFRARHIHLGRLAAIKVLNESIAIDSTFQARFQQEARAAASLNHPHIITIYEFGEQEGRAFLAMELSTAESLREWLRQKPERDQGWTLADGLELVRQAADGLAYAHSQGIIHRDIKPDNFMLTGGKDGAPLILKIGDFGLARLAEGSHLTATNTAMGSPAYMSPEQCQALELDGRSDLYSFGVVLYEVVTGRLPFMTRSISDAVFQHVYSTPQPPSQFRPELPSELEMIILRCLAKQPNERFATAADLASALRQVLAGDAPALRSRITPNTSAGPLISQQPATVSPTFVRSVPPAPMVDALASSAAIPLLRILDAQGQAIQVKELYGDGLVIGRSPSNDLVLDSQTVSRRHLQVDWDGHEVTVTDLGSGHGTRLDGTPLLPHVPQVWSWRAALQVGEFWLRLVPPLALPVTSMATPTPPFVPTRGPTPIPPPPIQQTPSGGVTPMIGLQTVPPPNLPPPAPSQGITNPGIGTNRIDVQLSEDTLRLTPGQPSAVRVTLANLGTTIDHLTLGVDGVPTSWIQGPPQTVQLLTGSQTQVPLTINAPRVSASRAGSYPVTVLARSRENPNESGRAAANWTVLPFSGSSLELLPRRVRARHIANYILTLSNLGNAPASYRLSCEDDELVLDYDLKPEHTLEPGEVAQIPLAVKRSPHWFGAAQQYVFRVHARKAGAEIVGTAGARFQQEALLPQWAAWLALALIVVGFLTVLPELAGLIGGSSSQVIAWLAQRWFWLALVGLLGVVLLNRAYLLAGLRQLKGIGKRRSAGSRLSQSNSSASDTFRSKGPTVYLRDEPIELGAGSPSGADARNQAAEPVQGNATIILKRRGILNQINDQILEELVLHQSYEQLWRAFAYAEGERILLTGYGPFGGTSLVNCAIEKARQELKRNGHGEGALLVFHFQLTREAKDEFAVEANHFSLGRLRAKDEPRDAGEMEILRKYAQEKSDPSSSFLQRMDFALDKPVKTAFFDNSKWNTLFLRKPSETYDLRKFVDDIHNFLEQHQDNTALQQIILRLAGSEALPSRIVIIFDKICYLETLEAISSSDLFNSKRILALVVVRREDFDQWQQPDTVLKKIGFKEWYIPCIWKSNLDKVLFESDAARDQEVDEQWLAFRKHLEYVGRGSMGNIIEEIRESKNISYGSDVSFINVSNMKYRDDIRHNAWMQDVLDLNWEVILGDLIAGKYRDSEDRARIGVYYVVDWIAKRRRFNTAQLKQEAQVPISISREADLVDLTIQNLLYVLVNNRYLKEYDYHYHVVWKREKPPVPRRVRLKDRHVGTNVSAADDVVPDRADVVDSTPDLDQSPVPETESSGTTKAESGDTALRDESPAQESDPTEKRSPNDTSRDVADDDRLHLLELRNVHKRRRRKLEVLAARSGADVDPKVLMEIEELNAQIQRLSTMLGEDPRVAE